MGKIGLIGFVMLFLCLTFVRGGSWTVRIGDGNTTIINSPDSSELQDFFEGLDWDEIIKLQNTSLQNYSHYVSPYVSNGMLSDLKTNCEELHGCWKGTRCFASGQVVNKTYCIYTGRAPSGNYRVSYGYFKNQSRTGESCTNNYECETYTCLNAVCIELNKENNTQIEELRKELENTKTELNKLKEAQNVTESSEENSSISITGGAVGAQEGNFINNIFGKVKEFFKGVF